MSLLEGRAAKRTGGARGKVSFGAPMTSLFSNNKTKNRWTVLQSVENTYKRGLQMQPLMPCTCPDFDGALFNFRIFLKLGAPRDAGTRKGPGGQTLLKGTDKILIMLKSIPWNLEGQLHSSCAKFLPIIFLAWHLRSH